ncbi:AAA family ATPase [Candidatus Bathyarchaeota archaeon]|nr:AAA family ATPase [Candidatus Bathyarchaeota archaeon]
MASDRIPSGIEGLDKLIEGGFPRGSLILLSGSPGVGKTVFAASFVCKGVQLGETGVYASLCEDKETLLRNLSRHLRWDYRRCVEEGAKEAEVEGKTEEDTKGEAKAKAKCVFLDFAVMRGEGVAAILDSILDSVRRFGARRLVIDSISALVQGIEDKAEMRILLQAVLRKIVRREGCTALLISEEGISLEGRDSFRGALFGAGVGGFVADGLIRLGSLQFDGRPLRELEIVKLRGTRLQERMALYTLEGGFIVFPPSEFELESAPWTTFSESPHQRRGETGARPKPPLRFEAREDPPWGFSTGCQDLDALLGGGYRKGYKVLLEVAGNVSTLQYHTILRPTVANFMAKGRGVIVIPSSGVDSRIIRQRLAEVGFTDEEMAGLLRICTLRMLGSSSTEPYVIPFDGKDIMEDYRAYLSLEEGLLKERKGPVLSISGIDFPIANYGVQAAMAIWHLDATRIRERGALGILIAKPGYEKVSKTLGAIADVHLKLAREHGALILYGVKPRTNICVFEVDFSRGYALPRLTPVV